MNGKEFETVMMNRNAVCVASANGDGFDEPVENLKHGLMHAEPSKMLAMNAVFHFALN